SVAWIVGHMTQSAPARWGRLLARATAEDGAARRFNISNLVDTLVATPDGSKVYAATGSGRTLSIIHTKDGQVRSLRMPRDGGSLAMSPDGRRLYVGSSAGGIITIDTRKDVIVDSVIDTAGPVIDLAITPDGRK